MSENLPLRQKPITHFLQEEDVPKDKQEKVLFAISKLVHDRNEEFFEAQRINDPEKQKASFDSIAETDIIIAKKIRDILENKNDADDCTDCFTD